MNFISITDKFQPYALILLVINNVYTLCGLTRQIPRCKSMNKIRKAYSVRFKVRSIILLVPILLGIQEGKNIGMNIFFTPIFTSVLKARRVSLPCELIIQFLSVLQSLKFKLILYYLLFKQSKNTSCPFLCLGTPRLQHIELSLVACVRWVRKIIVKDCLYSIL